MNFILTLSARISSNTLTALLFQLFLEEGVGLRLLGTHRTGLEGAVIASRIILENGRPELVVVRDEDHAAAKGTHLCVLGVHLADVRNSAAKHIYWHVVPVLVLPPGRFVPMKSRLRIKVSPLPRESFKHR